ncbi:unnamed protein product [Symbiodinium sp. CCMP2592]|nr:unnamed protein product [Symbiodinium sp. CCMP2592]
MAVNAQCPLCWSSGVPPFEHVTRPTGGLPNTKAKIIQEILETPGCSMQKADLERQLCKELRHVLQQATGMKKGAMMHLLREHWQAQCNLAAAAGGQGTVQADTTDMALERWELVRQQDPDDEDDDDGDENDEEQPGNTLWQELDEAEVMLQRARQRVITLRQRLQLPMFCDRGTQTLLCFADQVMADSVDDQKLAPNEAGVRRADKIGGTEYIHALVCSGTVSWSDAEGKTRAEELNLPPRQVTSTAAKQVGPALLQTLEQMLFGCSFLEFLQSAKKKYRSVGFSLVADSAKANLKTVRDLTAYVVQQGEACGLLVTLHFIPCLMHQIMRVVLLNMDHKGLTAAMYSLSRLQLSTTTKERTFRTMRELLHKNFVYKPNESPPDIAVTRATFRRRLAELLKGCLSIEVGEMDMTETRCSFIDKALEFFNGDITNKQQWCHYCRGCHRDQQHAMNDVPCQQSQQAWPVES